MSQSRETNLGEHLKQFRLNQNMKILFLDIDGVLINRKALASSKGIFPPTPDPEAVKALNRVLDETGAYVCVSSCWRAGKDAEQLQDLLNEWGVDCEVVGKTPYLMHEIRGIEIQEWLDKFQFDGTIVDSFVIIDDDKDMGELMPYLVKTVFEWGLTEREANFAIRILNA